MNGEGRVRARRARRTSFHGILTNGVPVSVFISGPPPVEFAELSGK